MASVAPKKRSSSESIDVLAMGLSGEKKPRVEGGPEFTQLVAEGGLEVGSVYRMDLGFGEWGGELMSGLGGGDVLSSSFESFCSGSTLDIVPVTEGSDVSSDDDRPTVKLESAEPSAQSGRRMTEKEAGDETATVKNEGDINLKRQADRAARNRESSRRAREKAKNRFRTLENENTVQREMIRRFRIQNENLMARLERASAMQQSCTMCRYNASMVQQPSFGAQSGQGLRR